MNTLSLALYVAMFVLALVLVVVVATPDFVTPALKGLVNVFR